MARVLSSCPAANAGQAESSSVGAGADVCATLPRAWPGTDSQALGMERAVQPVRGGPVATPQLPAAACSVKLAQPKPRPRCLAMAMPPPGARTPWLRVHCRLARCRRRQPRWNSGTVVDTVTVACPLRCANSATEVPTSTTSISMHRSKGRPPTWLSCGATLARIGARGGRTRPSRGLGTDDSR